MGEPISPPGPRDLGLVSSACERPKTSNGEYEKYKTLNEKAAAFFHSLVKNHAFHNGNKRTALVSTIWFLDLNNRRIEADDDELFEFVKSVAEGKVAGYSEPKTVDEFVQQIRDWLGKRIETIKKQSSCMRTTEFLEKVKIAGGSYVERRGSWIVYGPGTKSIKISGSTREMNGSAIKKYLQIIGLSEAHSGIRFSEFQDGISGRQDIIRRFISVLRRLAHI